METAAYYYELRTEFVARFGALSELFLEWPIELQIPVLELALEGEDVGISEDATSRQLSKTTAMLSEFSHFLSES